jgi:hypothetical protein
MPVSNGVHIDPQTCLAQASGQRHLLLLAVLCGGFDMSGKSCRGGREQQRTVHLWRGGCTI